MRLRKILIAVDFTEPSTAAARWVARHFGGDAELVLAHVIDIPQPPPFLRGMLPPHDELVETTRHGAEKRLRELGTAIGGGRIWPEVRVGRAAEQILAVADETGADLIAIGDHGRRRGLWTMLGSTAERVLEGAKVPVLLAANVPDATPSLVLVPVDASEQGRTVLEAAKAVADRFGSEILALHVFDPRLYGRVQFVSEPRGSGGEGSELRLSAARWLDERIADAELDPARTRAVVALGAPGYEIHAAAERHGAQLIVMGSRSAGGLTRAILGSVARAVLRSPPCPVLVLRD